MVAGCARMHDRSQPAWAQACGSARRGGPENHSYRIKAGIKAGIKLGIKAGIKAGSCYRLRSTPRYRLVCICFPTPGRGLPYGSGLGLSRCLGPGECLHSFIHATGHAMECQLSNIKSILATVPNCSYNCQLTGFPAPPHPCSHNLQEKMRV